MVSGTGQGVDIRETLKKMPYTLRVGNIPGGMSEFITLQAAINYADTQTGDWVILVYSGTYIEGDITPGGGADITIKAMGEGRVVIAPAVAPATAVVVSGHTLTLEDIVITAPDATRPALQVTGGVCVADGCEFNGVGAGDAIHMTGGTLELDVAHVEQGNVTLDTAACNLLLHNSRVENGNLNTAGAFPHTVRAEYVDFNGNNINNLATGATVIEVEMCSELNILTDSSLLGTVSLRGSNLVSGIKNGTSPWTVYGSEVALISNNNAVGAIATYGGYIFAITRAIGSIAWWLDTNTLKVIPSGTITDTVIQWAVNAAGAGDVVLIHPGTYSEQVTCASGVDLKGVGPKGSVILERVDSDVLILANNVEVDNLTIRLTTPTAQRTLISDNTVACACRLTNLVIEITTPGAFNHVIFAFSAASTVTIDSCFYNIGGTGATVGVTNWNAAATIHVFNNDFTFQNVNAYHIQIAIAGSTWTGGNNRWAGTCGLFTANNGAILFDGDRVDCLGASNVTGGSVCIKNGLQEYHVWPGMLIQHAVTAAAADTPAPSATSPYTVVIHPGVYAEAVTLSTYVNLIGVDKSACIIDNDHSTLITMAEHCYVANLTLNVTADVTGNGIGVECNNVWSIIHDLIINMSQINNNAYAISENTGGAAKPIYIRNVRVSPPGAAQTFGLYINQDNKTVYVENCHIECITSVYIGGASTVYAEHSELIGDLDVDDGVLRLRSCSYREVIRSAVGNIVDESPELKDAPWHVIKWSWQAALANSQVAVRGTPIDAGTGQVLLEVTDNVAGEEAVEALTEAAGALGNHLTPARTPRCLMQFAADAFDAHGTTFFGLRETLGNNVPAATEEHAGFIWDGANFKSSSDDGAATESTNLTTPSVNTHHQLEVIIFGGVSVEFYVDGALRATHTTRVPSAVLDWQHLNETAGAGGGDLIQVTVRNGGVQECPS